MDKKMQIKILLLTGLRKIRCIHQKSGSATLEYIIVSTFAVLLSIAAISFVGRMVKTKVNTMAEKLQMNAEEFDFDLGFTR